ncbi:hypothetical protein SAMN02744035_02770 [Thalassobacter stenotrophicus DSM 16310]|nr:hypothetical protein SAMN02744035_02770 [Thalassobacter stenotrophicus DSM 16310]
MYEVTPSATLPSIISKADFDRVVSAEMHGEPSAFSKRIAGGRFTQDRLDRAYGALARKALKNSIAEHGRSKILSRREYLDYYNLNIFRRH